MLFVRLGWTQRPWTKARENEAHFGRGRVVCTIHLIHEHFTAHFHSL